MKMLTFSHDVFSIIARILCSDGDGDDDDGRSVAYNVTNVLVLRSTCKAANKGVLNCSEFWRYASSADDLEQFLKCKNTSLLEFGKFCIFTASARYKDTMCAKFVQSRRKTEHWQRCIATYTEDIQEARLRIDKARRRMDREAAEREKLYQAENCIAVAESRIAYQFFKHDGK